MMMSMSEGVVMYYDYHNKVYVATDCMRQYTKTEQREYSFDTIYAHIHPDDIPSYLEQAETVNSLSITKIRYRLQIGGIYYNVEEDTIALRKDFGLISIIRIAEKEVIQNAPRNAKIRRDVEELNALVNANIKDTLDKTIDILNVVLGEHNKENEKTISAIILMAGSSTRFVDDNNKLSYQIINRPVFTYSLETFYNHEKIEHLYLVVSSTTINEVEEYVKENLDSSKITIVMGGLTRAQSVRNAVKEVKEDFVLIHDAARPLVNKVDIDNLINQMDTNLLGTLYHPIYDTVKDTSNNKVVTLDRQNLKATTTPQFFSKKLYEKS